MRVRTATSVAVDKTFDAGGAPPEVEVVDFSRSTDRPFGARFGTLVHAVLAAVPLNASERIVSQVAQAQSRIVPLEGREPYVGEEVYAAVEVVTSVLRDSLFDRVRLAERAGRCERELPITWKAPDGTLIEGAADLVFEDLTGITRDRLQDRPRAGTRPGTLPPAALGLLPGARLAARHRHARHSGAGSDSGLRAQGKPHRLRT